MISKFISAIFLMLFSFQSFGGEWHSAGNSPPPPHFPETPAQVRCQIRGFTTVGKKSYRFVTERVFSDQEFRASSWGVVGLKLEQTGDPGMDGQVVSVSFSKNQGVERMDLRVRLKSGSSTTNSVVGVARGETARLVSDLNVDQPRHGQASWVRVVAECQEIN